MREFLSKLNDFWTTSVFYTKAYAGTKKPPSIANVYWIIFTTFALLLVVSMYVNYEWALLGQLAWPMVVVFVVGEATAIVLNTKSVQGGGWTYSEWNWHYVPSIILRAAWGSVLSISTAIYIHPAVGILLAMWLISHFAMRSRKKTRF